MWHLFTTEIAMSDDKPLKNHAQLVLRMMQGIRLKLVPSIPEPYQQLIQKCWDQQPDERPAFADIVKRFDTSDELYFQGTDVAKFREYKEKLAAAYAAANRSPKHISLPPGDTPASPDAGPKIPRPSSGGLIKRFDFLSKPKG
jgi:hypothetical protein